jgi:hypothetical protein
MTFDPVLMQLTLSSVDPIDLGSHIVTFAVSLQNFPTAASLSMSVAVTIIEPPCDITQIATIMAPSSITYILNVDKTKEIYFDFVETPSCGLKYSLSEPLSFV